VLGRWEPRSLAEQLDKMEDDVIRRGGSFDVPFDIARAPARPRPKQKEKK
jgi:hypothetical protein